MKYYILTIIFIYLSFFSCANNEKNGVNYKFAYGLYAKKYDNDPDYIYNIYDIKQNSLDIITYNEKSFLKNNFKQCEIVWHTTNDGIRIGYNDSDELCVVYYNGKFYFHYFLVAVDLIREFKQSKTLDRNLILKDTKVANLYGAVKTVNNEGLIKLTSKQADSVTTAQSVTYEDVIR
jgi:hypothetical protein